MREPVLRLGPSDSEIPGDDAAKKGGLIGVDIPVWIHVVTDGAAGAVSDTTIAQQLAILNLAFSGFYGGVDTGFRFKLRGVDRTNNPAWYAAGPETPEERAMKKALKRGGPATLNLYTTSGELYLGWAYFPKIVSTKDRVLDGVVIDYRSMPGGEYGTDFSLGQTATHEIGHWLGLYHTFDRGCKEPGDRIDDTPFELEPTSGCPEGKDTCRKPGLDPIHNYMDYSFDSCYEEFTNDQSRRMSRQYDHWRSRDV
jgi:hypothetical protein